MIEERLRRMGITIEPFIHHPGSPYGRYWGFIVKDGKEMRGKNSVSTTMVHDPFSDRSEAVEAAVKCAKEKIRKVMQT